MIDRAIRHVREQQSPDGSFVHLSGTSPNDFSHAIARKTTFFTANILSCLQNIPPTIAGLNSDSGLADIQAAGIKFLLSQRNGRWSFNYWARDAEERTVLPYPDDLDDTFAALAAIARYDARALDGHAFAAIATLLTAHEVDEGGPYRTWLVHDDAPQKWQDVDVVVNSTIGYFLSLGGVRLPRLKNFIDDAVRAGENRLSSPYYPGIFAVGYFLSRFYKSYDAQNEKLAAIITEQLADHNSGNNITTLEYAMAISALINLGEAGHAAAGDAMHTATANLIARLDQEGFLPSAFCIDPSRGGDRCYAGASALTAAFCAEALAQYSALIEKPFAARREHPLHNRVHEHIRALARTACRPLPHDLRAMAMAQIEKTPDPRITAPAPEFYTILRADGKIISPSIIEQLSLANLFGWMAYNVYDDALDGEGGTTAIPCANFFLRALAEIYYALGTKYPALAGLFRGTMDRIDAANAREQHHCRIPWKANYSMSGIFSFPLPRFGDHHLLADRSIGHAMGPLAELLIAGYGAESETYRNTELFFRHYLIARQLHDDAHDWADDLLRGRINSVAALIIHRFREKYSAGSGAEIIKEVFDVLPSLKKIFWEDTVGVVAQMIVRHITAARRARAAIALPASADFMESELRRLEAGARRAIAERNNALIFLNDYKDSAPSGARP